MKYLVTVFDNDFHNTLQPFCDIMESSLHDPSGPLTKEQVVAIWEGMCLGLYLRFQNPFKYRDMETEEGRRHITNYLTSKFEVIVGESEIAKFEALYYGDSNGEWFYFHLPD